MRNHRGEVVVVWMVKDSISKSKSGSRLEIQLGQKRDSYARQAPKFALRTSPQ